MTSVADVWLKLKLFTPMIVNITFLCTFSILQKRQFYHNLAFIIYTITIAILGSSYEVVVITVIFIITL